MDKGIIELVERMNNVLSFVEDADTLRNKLTSLTESIKKILATIKECSTAIQKILKRSRLRSNYRKRRLNLRSEGYLYCMEQEEWGRRKWH